MKAVAEVIPVVEVVVVQACRLHLMRNSKRLNDVCWRLHWKIFSVPVLPHWSRELLLLHYTSSRHDDSSTMLPLIDITCLFINRKVFTGWSRLSHMKAEVLCFVAEALRLFSLVVQRCRWRYMSALDVTVSPITPIRVHGRWQLPLRLPKPSLPRCLTR